MTKNSTHLLSHKLWATSSNLTNPGFVLRVSRMQSGCQWSLWAHPRLSMLFQDDSCWQNSAPCCEELKPYAPKGCLHFHGTRLSLQADHVHHDSRCSHSRQLRQNLGQCGWSRSYVSSPLPYSVGGSVHTQGKGTTQKLDYTRIYQLLGSPRVCWPRSACFNKLTILYFAPQCALTAFLS